MSRQVAVGGYGECGNGIVRGRKFGAEKFVRTCFVVICRKMGSFSSDSCGVERSCDLPFEEVSCADLRCFTNAVSAFVNYR